MATGRITIRPAEAGAVISPLLYGHFAEHLGGCIEGGFWVGPDSSIPNDGGIRLDVVEALRRVRPGVLRWPGGCFADDYHWRDGIGDLASRPRRINIWWGNDIETNQFGTHEFIRLCRLIGAEPYLAGNLGSGTPGELRDWVEYCNFPGDSALARERAANGSPEPFGVRFWGVGNENWGCGGNMTPDEYASAYRRYATFLSDFGETPLFLIACGPNGNDHEWTREFFATLSRVGRLIRRGTGRVHGFAAHYYTDNRDAAAGTDTEYDDEGWHRLLEKSLRVESLIVEQRTLLDEVDPERQIGLIIDEWGTWHPPTPGRNPRHLWQQNTLRDALVAAFSLDTFNRHADKLVMTNIAQTVNVLQALLLTEGDRLARTPTYHVYEMFTPHHDARTLPVTVEVEPIRFGAGGELPGLAGSASLSGTRLTLTVVNPSLSDTVETVITLAGGASVSEARATVLTHDDPHAHNTVDAPEMVRPSEPAPVEVGRGDLRHAFAPRSVTRLDLMLA